jgi:hypothetical protein
MLLRVRRLMDVCTTTLLSFILIHTNRCRSHSLSHSLVVILSFHIITTAYYYLAASACKMELRKSSVTDLLVGTNVVLQ